MAKEHAMIESGRRQSLGKRIWKNRWVYLFLLPGIAFVLLFCYGPMYGLVVAFKDYKISKGTKAITTANKAESEGVLARGMKQRMTGARWKNGKLEIDITV